MTAPVRMFAELMAGMAAVSLCLQGGRHARPPCSRPGNKAGLASSILGLAGLHPGSGASAYLWCEPEPGPRALLQCYPDPVALRAVAATVRGWIGRPPRPLWDELRAMGPAAGVPGWLFVQGNSFPGGGGWKSLPTNHPGCEANRSAAGLDKDLSALARLGFPPTVVGPDARAVDPAVVARWLLLQRWSYSEKGPAHGYGGPGSVVNAPTANWTTAQRDKALERERLADLVEASVLSWPDVLVGDDARSVHPDAASADLDGCVVYLDPPYVGTTPYANALTRAEVVDLALRWDAAGATVLVSEAVPVAELDLPGWHVADLSRERKGQARTWGGTPEFVTMNRAPVIRPATQPRLFAVSA